MNLVKLCLPLSNFTIKNNLYNFQYVGYMCEMVPLKLCIENVEIFKVVLTTMELGLTMFGHEITSLCTDFIQSAASFLCRHDNSKMHEAYNLLKPFLKVIYFVLKLYIQTILVV